jgi:DNA-binding NtrC family response regulator
MNRSDRDSVRSPATILVADDQADVRESLKLLLEGEGCRVLAAASPDETLELVRSKLPDAVILDLNYQTDTTSGEEGLELLGRLHALDPGRPVIVLTGWGTTVLAIEAMRRGAQDFLEKPWDNTRVVSVIRNQLALVRARRENRRLTAATRALTEAPPPLVGRSRVMQRVLEEAGRVAASNATILITGESGTGKGLLASWIHERSPRAEGPFVRVNLGGLVDSLIESELYGHVRGAFTDARSERLGRFELANQGTLFLDEIANLSPVSQASLLHALEEGRIERVGSSRPIPVDVRILAATNVDIRSAVAKGQFRGDLLYRLNTIEITLPPLRERGEDIELLASHFFAEAIRQHGKPLRGISPRARETLTAYDWPGNVRELGHVLERAVLLASGDWIEPDDLRLVPGTVEGTPSLENMTLEEAERYLVSQALERSRGDAEAAARQLGVSRSALYRRLAKYRQ